MTIKERIQTDKANAFKSGNKELNILLSTVIGEMDRTGKNPTDEECLRIIKKMAESSKECELFEDVKLLETYLPELMTEDELYAIISTHCKIMNWIEKKDMGNVMKHLKEHYTGRYDGKLASTLVSQYLK